MSQRRTDNNKMASRNQRNATAKLERGLAQTHMIPWEELWKFELLAIYEPANYRKILFSKLERHLKATID